ncbi:MBL fold metallo-hydrolase [Actinacidiphila guanduensis]|uniref:Glyoxylase, beta-lactamase superfamily II n=1 Tax=Actinacidiphila guanduensis TaxID=310781 RepID=A0A1G9VTW4_9ACTN|nr:MBL fold metallo-hydrolase [Actinacidiphila guanduensis]SDM75446.1 Glyoxylase, beta-lactamase superfamily II [Actinacidiphila guanduensis]
MAIQPHRSRADRRGFVRLAVGAAAGSAAVPFLGKGLQSAAAVEPSTSTTYAPIPPAALGPALNSDGYFVGRIKGNLYWITDSYFQAMFLSTREGVVVVDAPPTIGNNLLRGIREVTTANGRPSRVTHLIYSHSHADHIGAASVFGKDVVRIGHTETRRLLRSDRDPHRMPPSVTFDDRFRLSVGGETLELAHHGPNHSPDNIFVYAPDYETLMVVDVLYPGWVPFKWLAVSSDIPGWITAHDIALRYPWTTLVGGHIGRLGHRADAELQKQYVTDLETGTRDAIATLDPAPFEQEFGPSHNSWAIHAAYLDAAAQQVAAPIVAKYLGKLAAVDVFTLDNAATMVESVRIDAGVLGAFGIHP